MLKAFITVGLGFGDEGKGSVVSALCSKTNVELVVRYSGGCQCAHNVVGPDGKKHPFAQFGSGTFHGIPTWLAPSVIIDPLAMKNEANALELLGCRNLFYKATGISVHPKCLVTTPYHAESNQCLETSLNHGSCGMGIGMTRKYWLDHGEDSVFAEDLKDMSVLHAKLELMRQRYLSPKANKNNTPSMVFDYMNCVLGESAYQLAVRLHSAAEQLAMNGIPDKLLDFRLSADQEHCVVFEGAQGILLDENYGCHPHTTWSDVTPRFAIELCNSWNIQDRKTIGVIRSYMTRHGNGPLPTELVRDDKRLNNLIDSGNPHNKWQGVLRKGVIDLPLIQYAADVIGTICPLDYLAINCLDELPDFVHVCYGRRNCTLSDRRLPDISVWRLSELLWSTDPSMMLTRIVSDTDILTDLEGIAPIGMMGYGPTDDDKRYRGILFDVFDLVQK